MKIEIDQNSGFCFGVVYAIKKAEEELEKGDFLYCLGDIVHNSNEVERLKQKGLITIDHQKLKELSNCKVLLRAHGEPPETYRIAFERNIELIDATCPVVLRLQNKIKDGYDSVSKKNGQVVIYGKEGHAEVNGLVGQIDNKAIIINSDSDFEKINYNLPINLFSQTTQSLKKYLTIAEKIKQEMELCGNGKTIDLTVNDTICRQVERRDKQLQKFAKEHDLIIFVSGKKSSNGKVLYNVCKAQNEATYFVSTKNELQKEWFCKIESVGVCGATSTPRWLMEEIASAIENIV